MCRKLCSRHQTSPRQAGAQNNHTLQLQKPQAVMHMNHCQPAKAAVIPPQDSPALWRACAYASSCSLWFFSGLNCATLTRNKCLRRLSSGRRCSCVVSQGGCTSVGWLHRHHSWWMWEAVQEEFTMTTSGAWAEVLACMTALSRSV